MAALMRHLSEFCHAVCSWRRVDRAGRHQSLTSSVRRLVAVHRLRPGRGGSVRARQRQPRLRQVRRRPSGFSGGSQISPATMSALLAAQSQSSTDRHIGADQPVRRAAGPVLADRRQWRRPDHQIGIRKRARRRRHQHRAGRRCVQQARHQWRRLGQPRRIVVGAEGRGRQWHGHHHVAQFGRIERVREHRSRLRSAAAGAERLGTSVTNSDGSTTTSLTYADGSKVTMTSAAAVDGISVGHVILQFRSSR